MYTFFIKDKSPGLHITITRAMLSLAAISVLVYHKDEYLYTSIIISIALFIAAISIKLLVTKYKVHLFILFSAAAVLLFISTQSFYFAITILIYGYFAKFLDKKSTIEFATEGIEIRKLFTKPLHRWNEFSNIILKDGLLTLDFKNNKLLQVSVDEILTSVDEKSFNDYCRSFVQ